jgi:hypothetical protein
VEQLVELEIDGAGAILVRPRGLDPVIALKTFAAMDNPSTDIVARFAREHFAKLALERDLSPFEKDTYTPVLRYASSQLDRAGRYFPDHSQIDDRKVPPAGQNLVVTDTWVVYARPRSETFLQRILSACGGPSRKPLLCQALPLPLLQSLQTSRPTCSVT